MLDNNKGLAIFDFDGTLTKKDSFIEFIKFTNGSISLWFCATKYLPQIILLKLGVYPNHKLKETFFSFFYKDSEEKVLNNMGNEFCSKVLPNLILPPALKLIEWHKERGDKIVILSASSKIWLGKWCKKNDVDLVSTIFEVKNGLYTGKIQGKNCYGSEKLSRISQYLELFEKSNTYAYGDSASDLFYMKTATHSYKGTLNYKNYSRIPWLN